MIFMYFHVLSYVSSCLGFSLNRSFVMDCLNNFFNHLLLFLDILGKTIRCWCAIHATKATILSVYNQLWTLYQQMVGNVK